MINKEGDIGSPCRSPRLDLKNPLLSPQSLIMYQQLHIARLVNTITPENKSSHLFEQEAPFQPIISLLHVDLKNNVATPCIHVSVMKHHHGQANAIMHRANLNEA